MKTKVLIVPHTHYDAEVFLSREVTFQIGVSNLQAALQMIRSDPDFTFTLDQSCFVEPYLQRYPEQLPALKKAIHDGRLEVAGGMYVMPDLNLPSGESFIRQVLRGRRFFEQVLGVDVKDGWTLDSFGRHPQVPQLMVKCGFEHDAFQRLMRIDGPSEFIYRGIDGSELLCHWMAASYTVFFRAPSNYHEFEKFATKRLGVIAEHSVVGEPLIAPAGADLTAPEPWLPDLIRQFSREQEQYDVSFGHVSSLFSAAADKEASLERITDDLNPVFQGCNSARIEVKQRNRQLENLFGSWEALEALERVWRTGSAVNSTQRYDARSLRHDGAWEKVLFNQFHDIICGTHVDEVFEATMDRYKYAESEATDATSLALDRLVQNIDASGDGVPLVLFNTLGWERRSPVECEVAFVDADVFEVAVLDSESNAVPLDYLHVERFANGAIRTARLLFVSNSLPALGYEVYRVVPSDGTPVESDISTSHPISIMGGDKTKGFVENDHVRVEFDLWNGLITSLYDKKFDYEYVAQRPGANTVVRERDYGNLWQYNGPCKGDALHPTPAHTPLPDAGDNTADFSHSYDGGGAIRTGNACAEFRISHPFGSGSFSTSVRIYAGLRLVHVKTNLVNEDERVRYRVGFPTTIENGTTTHEIPFGSIVRPEGEYPAQNWIDLSDKKRGITMVNRGLPGNNVTDGVLMLSLLKCTAIKEGYGQSGGFKFSTPTHRAYEKGIDHAFHYAFVTHDGKCSPADATRQGVEFNNPVICVKGRIGTGSLRPRQSFVDVSADNVVISAFAEREDGVLIRLYEAAGEACDEVVLTLNTRARRVVETDLIERQIRELDITGTDAATTIKFSISPFEIKTFVCELRESEQSN